MDEQGEMTELWKACLLKHFYEVVMPIGQGGFGSVFMVHSQRWNRDFAAKVSKCRPDLEISEDSEIHALMRLDHPNIVQLYDFFTEEGYLFIILEYCSNGSLKDMIQRDGPLPWSWMKAHCREMGEAIQLCHNMGIAHRDIKAENVLIDVYGRPKLADFGLGLDVEKGGSITSTDGSLPYSPPEFFRSLNHDPFKSDIWALGITFYYMATGYLPWRSRMRADLIREITSASLFLDENEIGKPMKKLLSRMLDCDPAERPTMNEIMEKWMIEPDLPTCTDSFPECITASNPHLPKLTLRATTTCHKLAGDISQIRSFSVHQMPGQKPGVTEVRRMKSQKFMKKTVTWGNDHRQIRAPSSLLAQPLMHPMPAVRKEIRHSF